MKRTVPLTEEQLIELGDALTVLACASPLERERHDLETLKVDRKEFAKVWAPHRRPPVITFGSSARSQR